MEQKLKKVFCQIKCEPDSDLAESVWCALVLRQERTARLKLWGFSIVGFFSLAALLPAFEILSGDFAQTGFFDYLSLLYPGLSYDGSIFFYWRELALSLLESLPVMSILLMLALIFIFFLSLKSAVKQIKASPRALGTI